MTKLKIDKEVIMCIAIFIGLISIIILLSNYRCNDEYKYIENEVVYVKIRSLFSAAKYEKGIIRKREHGISHNNYYVVFIDNDGNNYERQVDEEDVFNKSQVEKILSELINDTEG